MRASRREFLNWVSASGITLSLSRLGSAKPPACHRARRFRGARTGIRPPMARGRVDGVAKVTGAKLYASDFRAADLPGWPANTSHAMLIRAPDATHVYLGMDLARLGGAMKPSVVVTAADLDKIGTRVPEFYTGDLFCPVGKTPLYLGQPVGAVDIRDVRRLRSGAPRLARWNVREVRRGNRPRRDAGLWRLSFYARGGRDAGRAGCLFADPGRLGQPRTVAERAASDLVAGRKGHRGLLRQGRDPWRADPS